MKAIDLTGQHFGTLFVISRAENNKHGQTMWNCVCEKCHETRLIAGSNLRNGHTRSCGNELCSGLAQNLTNQVFGKLRVIEYLKGGYWKCQCNCGKEIKVKTWDLTAGITSSCGSPLCGGKKPYEIIAGKQYNFWTVIGEAKNLHTDNKTYASCQCRCGVIRDVALISLESGTSKSCGCIKSHGEECISSYLSSHNITFQSQWNNNKKMRLSNGNPVFFDFAIFSTISAEHPVFCLEYHGEQHYFSKSKGWNTPEHLARTQERDSEKVALCQKANIPLEIISYQDFSCLENKIEELLVKYQLA